MSVIFLIYVSTEIEIELTIELRQSFEVSKNDSLSLTICPYALLSVNPLSGQLCIENLYQPDLILI